jgi:hypothetical protein
MELGGGDGFNTRYLYIQMINEGKRGRLLHIRGD